MDMVVPKHLHCPICFEIPVGSVLQCKEGHILCEQCYVQLSECPQCRAPFIKEVGGRIRNRLMEAMLDELRLPCPFKEYGCAEKLSRSGLQGHVESCRFGLEIADSVNLCQLLGFLGCHFQIRRENWEETIRHFQQQHDFILGEPPSFQQTIEKFIEVTSHIDTYMAEITLLGSQVFLQKEDVEECPLLILTILNKKDLSISWIPLSMDVETSSARDSLPRVEFSITSSRSKMPGLNWAVGPIDPFKLEGVHPDRYPFRMPVFLLNHYTEEGKLVVTYTLRGGRGTGMSSESVKILPEEGTPPQFSRDSSSGGQAPLPVVTCHRCNRSISTSEKLFQCMQCVNHYVCEKCFGMVTYGHLFALVKGSHQHRRVRASGKPVLPIGGGLMRWWVGLGVSNPNLKKLLDREGRKWGEKCSNPECRKGPISFICVECLPVPGPSSGVQLCKGCGMASFHPHHILAIVVTSYDASHVRRCLMYCGQKGMAIVSGAFVMDVVTNAGKKKS